MSAQGWTPGSLLGARDAAHADLLTAASATHIKVSIKDDTLGLGARMGRDPLGEPIGLDAFKGLLGRLNGKSDVELKQEQRKRDEVKLARYAAMKFQEVRFVSGGLLTQEKMELPPSTPKDESPKKSRKQKKDKSQVDGDVGSTSGDSKATRKSSKKSRSQSDEANTSASTSDPKKKKKSKKRKADAETAGSSMESSKEQTSQEESQSDIPASKESLVSRERRPIGRHVIRGRHIAQKKRALLDDKSLNEVSSFSSFG